MSLGRSGQSRSRKKCERTMQDPTATIDVPLGKAVEIADIGKVMCKRPDDSAVQLDDLRPISRGVKVEMESRKIALFHHSGAFRLE